MYSFAQLLQEIRNEADLTQAEFAEALGVSTVLVAMVETGQKEVSKNLVMKLAEKMDVHPATITPFLFLDGESRSKKISNVEKLLLDWGEKMQEVLIKKRAKLLKAYVGKRQS